MAIEFFEDESDLTFFNDQFENVKFQLFKGLVSDIKTVESFFSAFVFQVKNETWLENNWSKVCSLIGGEYQSDLPDEFSRWNIYLFFFSNQAINNQVKYKIENDKFFVRKIVVDNLQGNSTTENIVDYLNDHVFGLDIEKSESQIGQDSVPTPYSAFTKKMLAANLPLTNKVQDRSLRSSWLDTVILQDENNEI